MSGKYYDGCIQKLEEQIQKLTIQSDNQILLYQEAVGFLNRGFIQSIKALFYQYRRRKLFL